MTFYLWGMRNAPIKSNKKSWRSLKKRQDPDLLVKVTDPWTRILTKLSRIRNTGKNTVYICAISVELFSRRHTSSEGAWSLQNRVLFPEFRANRTIGFRRYRENNVLPDRLSAPGTLKRYCDEGWAWGEELTANFPTYLFYHAALRHISRGHYSPSRFAALF